LPRSIDHFLIYQQRVYDTTDFDQPLPLTAVPREPRDLPGGNRAHLSQTNLGYHPFKSCSGHCSGCRAAEIIIHNVDIAPAQLPQTLLHGVL
jgi:hypothetical protein